MAIDCLWLRQKVSQGEYAYSRHADNERQNDNLLIEEIEQALRHGRILEQYPDTGRGESCLVVGFTEAGKPIHVVCGRAGTGLVVVTVYVPLPPKFMTPCQRGN